jgi:dTDP-glucose 4,6-dehydratase
MQMPLDDLDMVLSRTANFWSDFGGARLFVTGGTGFVGSWLLQAVQHANDQLNCRIELVVLTRDADRARAQASRTFDRADTRLLTGDVTRFSAPVGAFDMCIHAATDVGNPSKLGDPLTVFDSVLQGTRRMLDLSQAAGARRFLQLSSGAVYGVQPVAMQRMAETYGGAPDPLQPVAVYGNAKRAAEALACAYVTGEGSSALQVSIARIFALLGPGLPLNGPFAAGNFVRDAIAGQAIHVAGDGRPVRSYLYIADLCVWLLRIAASGGAGQAYNVGSEHEVSIAELAQQLAAAAGTTVAAKIETQTYSDTLPPRYVPDTSKARQELELAQYTPFGAALAKTLQWARTTRQA